MDKSKITDPCKKCLHEETCKFRDLAGLFISNIEDLPEPECISLVEVRCSKMLLGPTSR